MDRENAHREPTTVSYPPPRPSSPRLAPGRAAAFLLATLLAGAAACGAGRRPAAPPDVAIAALPPPAMSAPEAAAPRPPAVTPQRVSLAPPAPESLLRGDVGALAGAALHLVKRAAAQRAAGDAAAAGETLERAVEIDPTCGFAYYDLAELHLEQGRAEQALAFADKALVVGGSYGSEWLSHAQLLLGRALQASGRTGEAADAYRRALALDAGNLPARIALRALP